MIHPQSLVDDGAAIGAGTDVWAFAHIMAGARVGNNCTIGDHTFIEAGAVVGSNVTVKNLVLIWEGVTIEDDAFIGPRVTFTNDRMPRSPRMPRAKHRYARKSNWLLPTLVQRGCSIGASATISPGIQLGSYSMIAAGSVVTKDVEPYALVMGSPARLVHYICSCGEKLRGHFLETACHVCGESEADRRGSCHPKTIQSTPQLRIR